MSEASSYKEIFFRELVSSGKISVDTETGTVFNLVTSRKIGYVNTRGYVTFGWKRGKRVEHILVHHAVWWSSGGTIPEGMEINHLDGVRANNSRTNLELVTPAENAAHCRKRNPNAWDCVPEKLRLHNSNNRQRIMVLSDADALRIFELRHIDKKKYTLRNIAKMFGVSHSTISDIIQRKSYRHLDVQIKKCA